MLAFLEEYFDTAYQPEELRILTAAFDKAWEAVQASGAKFDETERTAVAARTIIAKHIIEAAKQGERDQGRLRDGALLAYTQAALRTPLSNTASQAIRIEEARKRRAARASNKS
jgi:hypothetical protein